MKAAPFDHARPATLAEAVDLLAGAAGARAAGRRAVARADAESAPGTAAPAGAGRTVCRSCAASRTDGDAVTIGACVTHSAIADGLTPDIGAGVLARVAAAIAYRAVRNRGTIGGSLCHADPAADWVTVLIALDARCCCTGRRWRAPPARGGFHPGRVPRPRCSPASCCATIRIPRLSGRRALGLRKGLPQARRFRPRHGGGAADPGGTRRAVIGALGGAAAACWQGDAAVRCDGRAPTRSADWHSIRCSAICSSWCLRRGARRRLRHEPDPLTVNGEAVTAEVAPRTHLADFLREHLLLTGTHLGCEHGVCGACTLLIDGAPARSCITLRGRLRRRGGAHHRRAGRRSADRSPARGVHRGARACSAATARPACWSPRATSCSGCRDADEARIRLELAGNLCRCTGYVGIVRAIRRVLGEGVAVAEPEPARLPDLPPRPRAETLLAASAAAATFTPDFVQTVRIGQPIAAVWSAVGDIQGIVACVPGARLIELSGNRMRGEIRASLGPIETLFVGEGSVTFDAARRQAAITHALSAARHSSQRTGRGASVRGEFRIDRSAARGCLVTRRPDGPVRPRPRHRGICRRDHGKLRRHSRGASCRAPAPNTQASAPGPCSGACSGGACSHASHRVMPARRASLAGIAPTRYICGQTRG